MGLVQFFSEITFPPLVWFFQAVTFLGTEFFFLTLLPVLIWCWKKELAIPLTLILYSTFLINTGLKEWFQIARPDVVFHRADAEGFGFPSGHAQSAVMLWGYLAWRFKTYKWPALLIFLIGFSRVFLGVHTPAQVVGGWTIGATTLLIFVWLSSTIEKKNLVFPPLGTSLIFVFVGMTVSIQFPDPTVVKLSGLMAGACTAFLIEPRLIDFDPVTSLPKQVFKIIFAVAGVILVRVALKAVLPELPVSDWLRYGATGVWIGLGAPWLFNRIDN